MQNRTLAMILASLVVLLCGLPGICGVLFGLLAIGGSINSSVVTSSGVNDAFIGGIFIFCVNVIILFAAALIVYFLLRKPRFDPSEFEINENEPLPPAI